MNPRPCPLVCCRRLSARLTLALGVLGSGVVSGDDTPRPAAGPPVDRWYQTLLDDNLDGGIWSQAARELTRVEPPPVWPENWLIPAGAPLIPPSRPVGEALRWGRKPSVSDLLALRLDDLAARNQRPAAVRMAEHLLIWEPGLAEASLRKASRLIVEQVGELGGHQSDQRGRLVVKLARFAMERTALGDRGATADYAALIRLTDPAWFGEDILEALEPLYRLPDDPALADATRALFANPRSPWLALGDSLKPLPSGVAEARINLITSSLLSLPDFRRAVGGWLADRTEIGTAQARSRDRLAVQTRLGYQTEGNRWPLDGESTAPFESPALVVALRRADLVAWRLSQLEGAPRLSLDWPVARRDEAIAAAQAYLDRFGPSLKPDDPSRPHLPDERSATAALELPRLDHPATQAEVDAGQAIFSLDAEPGERRVVPLPEYPLAARWIAYRRPGERALTNPGSYRLGRVWQAEEVWQDGRWVRSFGLVVEHQMVRLPAAALDFGSGFRSPPSRRFSRTTPSYLVPPGAVIPWARHPAYPPAWPGGTPLPVPIRLRNLRGADLAVPEPPVIRRADGQLNVAAGLTLELQFSPLRRSGSDLATRPIDESKSSRIELRREVQTLPAPEATITLGPGSEGALTTVDLRDLFPIRDGGRYLLRVSYTQPGAREREPDAVGQALGLVVDSPPR